LTDGSISDKIVTDKQDRAKNGILTVFEIDPRRPRPPHGGAIFLSLLQFLLKSLPGESDDAAFSVLTSSVMFSRI
jgi:hypothetical protein